MTYVRWGVYALLLLAVAGVLHYSLPMRDIVYITGQEVKRQDTTVSTPEGQQVLSRDVNFIYAVDRDGEAHAFRNEDTDFGWPPYFKFDTGDISAQAENAISTRADPEWMVVTHYGWRIQMFSMFENVVALRPAASRDETLYPWFNGAVIVVLLILFLIARRMVQVVYRERVVPVFEQIDREWDEASDTVSAHYTGLRGWFARLLGR